jgi:hypothetical protein
LLDPEVWEHSSDYKPPPASHVTSVSTPLSVSAPVVTATPTVYVSIRWTDRKFYVLDPEDADGSSLCTADALPDTVTNDRLLAFYRLEKRLEELQERYDHERSYLDSAPDPTEFRGRGIDRAERLYLANRYEAALQEEAHLENTLGHELRVCEVEFKAAKKALEVDIFGPAPVYAPSDTVYFTLASDGSVDEIVGTERSILECVPPLEEPHEYFTGLYNTLTADLPLVVTNARLLEIWEAPAADKPELWAALQTDAAK